LCIISVWADEVNCYGLTFWSAAFVVVGGVGTTGAVIANPAVIGAAARDACMSLAFAGSCGVWLGWGVTADWLWLLLSRLAELSSLRATQFFVSLGGRLSAALLGLSVACVPYPQVFRHLQNFGRWWQVGLSLL